jgi:putative membrane protein
MQDMPDIGGTDLLYSTAFGLFLVTAAIGYLVAVIALEHRGGWWPTVRTGCWYAGLACAAATLLGPMPIAAHRSFLAHMTGHLLLGMAAPVLLVMAAPVTLALRTLPRAYARKLSRALRAVPVRIITHPLTAAVLNVGGLWLLYTTGLYEQMGRHAWLHPLINLHILAAGYLFTAAIVGVDPAPHRPGRWTRAIILIAFLAAHAILAKYLYAHPPAGVPVGQARSGAALLYYGGDLIDLAVIAVFCRQWYTACASGRPAPTESRSPSRPWRLPADY